jgi:hypothetical protein
MIVIDSAKDITPEFSGIIHRWVVYSGEFNTQKPQLMAVMTMQKGRIVHIATFIPKEAHCYYTEAGTLLRKGSEDGCIAELKDGRKEFFGFLSPLNMTYSEAMSKNGLPTPKQTKSEEEAEFEKMLK